MANQETTKTTNFIRNIIDADLDSNKHSGRVATRFPPEPNGYLHIGHAKSICLNFGVALDYAGTCNLRFDDTNPTKEEEEYVESIKEDVTWLGFNWNGQVRYASDYFESFYNYAVELVEKGKAFVCSLSAEEIRQYRGTLTQPGKESPYRNRPIAQSLELFKHMRAGKFKDGEHVLRAKIDMACPNVNMRDPVIFRILHAKHHQTGDDWCIYPMYDYAHCISDALEGITHSLCTLEFEDHRPLYDWVLDNISIDCHPQQIEFARLQLEYTIVSKRKLNILVKNKHVSGWDDPRMPTLAGIRRRGYTAEAVRDFCGRIGVTKVDTVIEMGVLENSIREDLDSKAPRAMAVIDPLKIVLEDYPTNKVETLTAANHPKDESLGTRSLSFDREIYIDRADFSEDPPKKFKRLIPGGEVRLRNAYVIKCNEVVKDDNGEIVELHCSYDENTLGKNPEGRKVKGVIHWVSVKHSLPAQIRLYDRLFNKPNPDEKNEDGGFEANINPQSLVVKTNSRVEQSLQGAKENKRFQFEREGYFCFDKDSTQTNLVFNRIVTLRDTWAKIEKKQLRNSQPGQAGTKK